MKLSVKNKKFRVGAILLLLAISVSSCTNESDSLTVLSDSEAQYQEFAFSADGYEKQWFSVRLSQGKRVLIDWTNINLKAIREESTSDLAEIDPESPEAKLAGYIENNKEIAQIDHTKKKDYTIFETNSEYEAAKLAGFTGFAYIKEFAGDRELKEFRIVYNRFEYLNSDEILALIKKEAKLKENNKLGEYSLAYINVETISLSFIQLWNSTGINGFMQSAQAKNLSAKKETAAYNAYKKSHSESIAETATFGGFGNLFMIGIGFLLLFLAINKGFEPLLLVPIGIGAILANVPFVGIAGPDGFIGMLYNMGVKTGLFPLLIFMGVGAMTDFGPLIANPKTFILGAAAQIGIFGALIIAVILGDLFTVGGAPLFDLYDAASIGIIGGADGPTAIFVTSKLSPDLLGAIAVAAYSYMALVPIIQPPIMKALTTKKERGIKMEQLRTVSKREKILFPLVVMFVTALLLPSAIPLLGALMFGNLAKECGVTDRLSDTMQNALINIVTIFLGLSVGSKMQAEMFLKVQTLAILALGLIAFSMGTGTGVIFAKFMNLVSKKHPINPLIGAAGVSAVPMAARVVSKVGQEENPHNFLLMHAMGPNVAGVIGSAVAAGILLNLVPFLAG